LSQIGGVRKLRGESEMGGGGLNVNV
jgi:hypothetical protein